MKKTLIVYAKDENISVEVIKDLAKNYSVCISTVADKKKFFNKWEGFVDGEGSRPIWQGEDVGVSNYLMKGDIEIYYENIKTKKCECCGRQFWYQRNNAKYCSEECRRLVNYNQFKKRMSNPEKAAKRREYMKLQMRRRRSEYNEVQ